MTRAVAFLAALLAGCGPSPSSYLRVERGELATDGVVIDDRDGRFRIVEGRSFDTPFWSYDCPALPTSENFDLGRRLGAQPVRVRHPAFDGELHGLLAFCMLHPDERGPVSREYQLVVPDEYVHETEGGRVSVVYEQTSVRRRFADGTYNLPAWILWLARRPFDR